VERRDEVPVLKLLREYFPVDESRRDHFLFPIGAFKPEYFSPMLVNDLKKDLEQPGPTNDLRVQAVGGSLGSKIRFPDDILGFDPT
jgi:hypothetical protein